MAEKHASTDPAAVRRGRPSPGETTTIVVAEDDAAIRDLISSTFEADGHTVIACAAGDIALQTCRERGDEIDVLITDVVMPGVSGIELTNLLKEEQPAIVPILISGYFGDDSPHQSTIPEHATLLSKPFMPTDLRSALKSALHQD